MKYNETCAHYQATTPGRGGDPALPPLSPSSLMHSQLCQTCPPFCNFSYLQKKLRNRHGLDNGHIWFPSPILTSLKFIFVSLLELCKLIYHENILELFLWASSEQKWKNWGHQGECDCHSDWVQNKVVYVGLCDVVASVTRCIGLCNICR